MGVDQLIYSIRYFENTLLILGYLTIHAGHHRYSHPYWAIVIPLNWIHFSFNSCFYHDKNSEESHVLGVSTCHFMHFHISNVKPSCKNVMVLCHIHEHSLIFANHSSITSILAASLVWNQPPPTSMNLSTSLPEWNKSRDDWIFYDTGLHAVTCIFIGVSLTKGDFMLVQLIRVFTR